MLLSSQPATSDRSSKFFWMTYRFCQSIMKSTSASRIKIRHMHTNRLDMSRAEFTTVVTASRTTTRDTNHTKRLTNPGSRAFYVHLITFHAALALNLPTKLSTVFYPPPSPSFHTHLYMYVHDAAPFTITHEHQLHRSTNVVASQARECPELDDRDGSSSRHCSPWLRQQQRLRLPRHRPRRRRRRLLVVSSYQHRRQGGTVLEPDLLGHRRGAAILRVVRGPAAPRGHAALQLHGRHQHRGRRVPGAAGQGRRRVGGVGDQPERPQRHGRHAGRGRVPELQRQPRRVPDGARQLRAVHGARGARGPGVPGVGRGGRVRGREGDGGVRDAGAAGREGEQVHQRVAAGGCGGQRRAGGAPHHRGQHPFHRHHRFQRLMLACVYPAACSCISMPRSCLSLFLSLTYPARYAYTNN